MKNFNLDEKLRGQLICRVNYMFSELIEPDKYISLTVFKNMIPLISKEFNSSFSNKNYIPIPKSEQKYINDIQINIRTPISPELENEIKKYLDYYIDLLYNSYITQLQATGEKIK